MLHGCQHHYLACFEPSPLDYRVKHGYKAVGIIIWRVLNHHPWIDKAQLIFNKS